MTENSNTLMLYDLATETWTRLLEGGVDWPVWTRDGRRLCFSYSEGPACLWVKNRKLERMPPISVGVARGVFGPWTGFTPDGEPLLLRDHGNEDGYALEWRTPEP
jgi:hypothetical protein